MGHKEGFLFGALMPISTRTRFEVFKRDSFTCQYCGAKAPDVTLHADHIVPVSKGGSDDILNLVTACQQCNAGKSNRELDDNSVVSKRMAQAEALQSRREQMEMIYRWHEGLSDMAEEATARTVEYILHLVPEYAVTDADQAQAARCIKKHGIDRTLRAISSAIDQYAQIDEDTSAATQESVSFALSKIFAICEIDARTEKRPYLKRLYYIRGIVKNRLYCVPWVAINLLEAAHLAGATDEVLVELAKTARNWTIWQSQMHYLIEELENGATEKLGKGEGGPGERPQAPGENGEQDMALSSHP